MNGTVADMDSFCTGYRSSTFYSENGVSRFHSNVVATNETT